MRGVMPFYNQNQITEGVFGWGISREDLRNSGEGAYIQLLVESVNRQNRDKKEKNAFNRKNGMAR